MGCHQANGRSGIFAPQIDDGVIKRGVQEIDAAGAHRTVAISATEGAATG